MNPPVQPPAPGHDFVAFIDSRLPRRHLLSVPEIAAAFDEDPAIVQGWLETGEIEGYDRGSGNKAYWKGVRASVIEFAQRRRLGIRAPAAKSLATQPDLFPVSESTEPKGANHAAEPEPR